MYEIGKMPASIDIGYTGEQEFRTVQIDMSEWVAKVPNGTPILMYIRPGESEPYPVEITYADNIITWSVTDGDLGTVGGTGLLQVWFGVEDEEQVMRKLGMSSVVVTIVHLSISGGANASTVQIPWLKEIMEMKNIILGYDYEAEAWAVGQRGGEDVPATDASYHNNAKYYSDQAEAAKTAAQTAQAACETEVSRQLSEIISNPDSPPLDRTLSSNVSAAPADMVGDLKSALLYDSGNITDMFLNPSKSGSFSGFVHGSLNTSGNIAYENTQYLTTYNYMKSSVPISIKTDASDTYFIICLYNDSYVKTTRVANKTEYLVPANTYFRISIYHVNSIITESECNLVYYVSTPNQVERQKAAIYPMETMKDFATDSALSFSNFVYGYFTNSGVAEYENIGKIICEDYLLFDHDITVFTLTAYGFTICKYSSDHSFISKNLYNTGSFVRIPKNTIFRIGILNNENDTPITDISALAKQVKYFDGLDVYPLKIKQSDLMDGYYLDTVSGGYIKSSSGKYASKLLNVAGAKYISIYCHCYDYQGILFFDEMRNKIGYYSDNNNAKHRIVAVPEGTKYFAFNITSSQYSSLDDFDISIIMAPGMLPYAPESRIELRYECVLPKWGKALCIGDSLTESSNRNDITYPQMFEMMSGIETTNEGHSGYTTKQWYDEYGATYDFTPFGTYLIWLGTNGGLTDTLYDDGVIDGSGNLISDYTTYADTNTGDYCKIIAKIISQVPKAKIFLANVFSSESVSVQKATNNVINKIASLFPDNILGVVNMNNQNIYDKVRDNILHPYDTLHFGTYGNCIVADIWLQNIRYLIKSNPHHFARYNSPVDDL